MGHLHLLPGTETLSYLLTCSPLPLSRHTADLNLLKGYRVLSWGSHATPLVEVTTWLPVTPAARLGPVLLGFYSPAHSSIDTSPFHSMAESASPPLPPGPE